MADRMEMKSPDPGGRGGWGLVLALAILLLILWVVEVRRQPPPPKPADAPATELSAQRSFEVLRELVGDGLPHPVGSSANAAVRDRIASRLRALGYAPELQEELVCGDRSFDCAQVVNVVARLEGAAPTGAVLFLAHYDSVAAGPGVSDDLAGVATLLESARALKAGPPPKNTVIFLFDEGEELGLLGAEVFARSPLAREVKAVVNLEARGTEGPSLLFETSGNDGWMIPRLAAELPHPVTSSVFVTIYQLMPNDTDLSVFKRAQVDGVNFAYLGGPTRYHTPLDNLEHLSLATLQHHGDNGLGAVRALAQADLAHPPPGNAVFFDVLSWAVVRWPQPWTIPLALIGLVLIGLAGWKKPGRGALPFRQGVTGFLAFLALIVLAALVAAGLTLGLQRVLQAAWIARPVPLVAAFWLLPLVLAGLILPRLGRRAGRRGFLAGVWFGWSLLGVLLAQVAPGASYLFIIPVLVAGLAVWLIDRDGSPIREELAALLPVVVAAFLWIPILLPLYDGLGLGALAPLALLVAILVSGLAPLYVDSSPRVRRVVTGLAGVGMAAGIAVAVIVPPYSAASPQPVILQYHEDTSAGQSFWLARAAPPLPPELRRAAAFGAQMEAAFPWSPPRARAWKAPAPRLGLPAPELRVLEDGRTPQGGRRLRLHLSSQRGARAVRVLLPTRAQLQALAIDGQNIDLERRMPQAPSEYVAIEIHTLAPEGQELDMVLGESGPLEWYVLDREMALPSEGKTLQEMRRLRPRRFRMATRRSSVAR